MGPAILVQRRQSCIHLLELLETEAARISTYQSMVIPWAFQTRDYAHAVIRGALPKIEDRVLEERVNGRLIRQKLLTKENPPRLWALIDESALRRQVGGRAVMSQCHLA